MKGKVVGKIIGTSFTWGGGKGENRNVGRFPGFARLFRND
jgi:hypothetical protein